MPDPSHLAHPPIVEALVHFQANASRGWETRKAQELARSLFPRHAEMEQQYELNVAVPATADEAVPEVVQQFGHGFRLRSQTEPTVHQVRRDGYSFSRLQPYDGWDHFIAAAKEGWHLYADAYKPQELHTLALRFINRLDFPAAAFRQERDSFLTIAPRPPKGLDWHFGPFNQHYSLKGDDSPCIVNLNLVRILEAGPPRHASMLLDIEVVLEQPLAALGLDVDKALTLMRRAKNQAFFHSLTEKALKQYH